MTERPLRRSRASPAHISRFHVDDLIETALKDEQTRKLLFYVESELQNFLRDSSMSKIQFPTSLSQYHKRLILQISIRFGLDGIQDPDLVLTKRLESAIPRTSLQDYWKSRSRPRTKTIRSTGRDAAGKSSNQSGEKGKRKGLNSNAPSWNARGGGAASDQTQYNNPYGNNYQSYSNPYGASHTQSNIASSNPSQKSRTAPPQGSNQSASYSNPYAAADDRQFTNADMDQWVRSNQRKKKREQRKKRNKKAKAKPIEPKTPEREQVPKVPYFVNKPFNKKTVDSVKDPYEKQNRRTRSVRNVRRSRSNQSNLPSHILHIYDIHPSIQTPKFLPRNSESIRESLSVFKSAKSPRNPYYHMCWNHNTEKGCPRGNSCNWIHCFVGVADPSYELDHALVAFSNEQRAEIHFVNPKLCLAVFHNESDASSAMDSINESSLFKLKPYSKETTEQLSNNLPETFFGGEGELVESSV